MTRRTWCAIAAFFAFEPYLGIGLLPSDIQPLAVMCAIVGLMLFSRAHHKFPAIVAPVVVILAAATISAVATILHQTHGVVELIRYYFGYLSAVVVLAISLLVRQDDYPAIRRALDAVLLVSAAGIILQASGAGQVVSLFVSRAVFDGVIGSSRGFTSFYPEQSRVAAQMAMVACGYALTEGLSAKRLLLVVAVAAASFAGHLFVVVTQLLIATIGAVLILSARAGAIRLRHMATAALVILISITFWSNVDLIDRSLSTLGLPRAGLQRFGALLEAGGAAAAQDDGVAIKLSGIVMAASAVVETPLSFQIGASGVPGYPSRIRSSYESLYYMLLENRNPPYPLRVYSMFGTWVVDFGLLGLLCVMGVTWSLLRLVLTLQRSASIVVVALFTLMTLTVKEAAANPTPWFLLGLIHVATAPLRSRVVTTGLRQEPSNTSREFFSAGAEEAVPADGPRGPHVSSQPD